MGKLRHIAIATDDPESLAAFYEQTFEFERVETIAAGHWGKGGAILSDGVMNLTIAHFGDDQTGHGKDFAGLHHIGFIVDDVAGATDSAVSHGATPLDIDVPRTGAGFMEIKFRDPSGNVFDIAGEPWKGSA